VPPTATGLGEPVLVRRRLAGGTRVTTIDPELAVCAPLPL
jgi:hypothetical protein